MIKKPESTKSKSRNKEYNSHGGMRDRMKAKQNELSRRKLNDEIVKKLINLENGR